jgi:hypothetical protein
MTIDKRQGAVFASGILLGAAAVAGAWKKRGPASPQAPEVPETGAPLPQPLPDTLKTKVERPRFVAEPPKENVSPPQAQARETVSSSIKKARVLPRQPWPEPPKAAAAPPQPAAATARQLKVFLSGSVLAAVAIAGAWLLLDPLGVPMAGKAATTASVSAPQASGQVTTCPLAPATAVASSQDGQFPFQPDVPGLTATDIASFIVIGKDAAASGRPRDAEVAFLMSCRLADKLKGADSAESADGKYLLGAHYAKLALGAGSAREASRPELLRRAEFLYLDSLRIYSAAHGQADERSRSAADGLAAVRQTLAQASAPAAQPAAPAVPVPEPSPQAVASASPAPETRSVPVASPPVRRVEVAKAALPASAEPKEPRPGMRSDASFDCSRARSAAEKMVCSDAELFQLNHEVGRLYARARNATADPAAFRRQNDLEASRRESICRDRGCLLRWYAYRRDQLMRDIEGRAPPRPTAWR